MSKHETSRTLEELRHSYSHDPSTVHNPGSDDFIGAMPCNMSHSPRRPLKARLDRAYFTPKGLLQHLVGYHGVPWGQRYNYLDDAERQYKVAKVKAMNAAASDTEEIRRHEERQAHYRRTGKRLFNHVPKDKYAKNKWLATIKQRLAKVRARNAKKN